MLMAGSTRRWSPGARAFSTDPATRTTVPLAHLAPLPASLPESGYNVTPPVQPWPRRLTARSFSVSSSALPRPSTRSSPSATRSSTPRLRCRPRSPSSPRRSPASPTPTPAPAPRPATCPPVLSLLRASRLPVFSDRPFLPLLRALRPLPSLRLFLSLPSFNSRPSTRSFNALLHSLVSARRLRLAAALFRAAPTKLYITPNLVSCNILLKGLVGVGDLDVALKVLDEMSGWGIVPDVVTYTTVLTAYCAKGDLEGAQQLFDDIIASGRRPDATMYTVLIDGYCQRGKLQDAARIMDEMEAVGVQPNEDGKAGEANEIWRQMVRKNVPPDNTVVSTLIYWLCKNGMIQEARKLFDELERGFVPSLLTYNSLIVGLCENGELQEAGRVWDDMVEQCGKSNEGYALFKEMMAKGCTPSKSLYQALVDSLSEPSHDDTVFTIVEDAALCGPDFLDGQSWKKTYQESGRYK
ncbi:unnamed protein product [Miscanthus lutarioriparius]|uniref:Pentatricopeptide repeat-containing protein n=1 Tax=Miscanthus lutarioriparius TaxID=422564 RepID=A0A811SIU5_9POAL|nr:unnamed protein product [Miscanthus lutarioriparius]